MDWIKEKIYRDRLLRLMLGVVSCVLIVIVAWWSELNKSGGDAGVKGTVGHLTEHRQSGALPAHSFTIEETRGDLKHGVISRLETLQPTAAGMGNNSASADKDKGKSRNTANTALLSESDKLPVTTEVQPHESISDTGPSTNAVPPVDYTSMHLQKQADSGDASAQFKLGMMHRIGEVVPKNATKAAVWFEKAAVQGNVNALYNLGVIYNTGEGVPENAAKAEEWLNKAASQANAEAQFNIGLMYNTGEDLPKD